MCVWGSPPHLPPHDMPKRKREPTGVWIGRNGEHHYDDAEEALSLCRSFFVSGDTDHAKLISSLNLLKHPTRVQRAVSLLERMRRVVEQQLSPLQDCADALGDSWGVTVDVDSVRQQLTEAVWTRGAAKLAAFFA